MTLSQLGALRRRRRGPREFPEKKIFIHIPKTAGVSLQETIKRVYPGDRHAFVYSHLSTDLDALRERVQRAEAVYGHFSFGIHHVFGIQGRYVTVLRNPVDRVVSFFRHQANYDDNEYHRLIAEGMTLKDLLRGEQCHQVNNHMVRIISGHVDAGVTHDRGLLDQAQANLDTHFDAVGITERIDESVALIGRALGWPALPEVPRINVTPRRGSFVLDEETRAEIVRYNALDIELYDRVVRELPEATPAEPNELTGQPLLSRLRRIGGGRP
jgi:Sulfotransferase family